MNILLLDDDPQFSTSVVEELYRSGHTVSYCGSLTEALDAVRRNRFDLFLIDLMLPPSYGSEGLQMLEYVKKHAPGSEVLMISQKSDKMTAIVDRAYQLGARRFLDKGDPGFHTDLLVTIEEVKHAMSNSIFISHGHAELIKLQLKDFLREKLGRSTIILTEQPSMGQTIVEKLEAASEKCDKAIILLTRDDEMADGKMRSRQNVIHEIGFFQGKYGRRNVILLCEEDVELFSNISGIVTIRFNREHFPEVFEQLRNELSDG